MSLGEILGIKARKHDKKTTQIVTPVKDLSPNLEPLDALHRMSDLLFTAREEKRHYTSEEGIELDELAMCIVKESGECPPDVTEALDAMDDTDRRVRFVKKDLEFIINGAEHLNRGGKHGVRKITYVATKKNF